jgi:hypothetical protein
MEVVLLIVGAIIGFFIAMYFYRRSTKDLKKETEELKHYNILILKGLENAKLIELSRDSDGNIKGLNVTLKGEALGLSIVSGKVEIKTKPKDV